MQSCFAAIAHGCADQHFAALTEVYMARVARGETEFARKKLGLYAADLAAIASFFDRPFLVPSPRLPPGSHGTLLSFAGQSLRAIGRLAEAAEPMGAAAECAVETNDPANAARGFQALSELFVTLGRIADAANAGTESVKHADASESPQSVLGLAPLLPMPCTKPVT